MELKQQIDVLDFKDLEKFKEDYFLTQKPVILKGLADEKVAGQSWSIKYFKEKAGDLEVSVFNNANKKSAKSAFTTPDLKMNFGEYLSIIQKDEKTDLRIFGMRISKELPDLSNDFPCPKIFEGVLGKIGLMFFGGKNTTVRIHYDIDMSNVLLTHFGGKKKVVLIAPQYTDLLYRLPYSTYSLINLDDLDFVKYPGLLFIKAYECTLEHGDSIFMPSGYWHYMTYLEGSMSVSYRKRSPSLQTNLKGLRNILLLMPFDKLMGKVIGPKWLDSKEKIAHKKAKRAIANLNFC
jgi:hypothetical protein